MLVERQLTDDAEVLLAGMIITLILFSPPARTSAALYDAPCSDRVEEEN